MSNKLVTLDELSIQIYLIEGIRIDIVAKDNKHQHLVRPYNYNSLDTDGMSDREIADAIFDRIGKCLEPYKWEILLKIIKEKGEESVEKRIKKLKELFMIKLLILYHII